MVNEKKKYETTSQFNTRYRYIIFQILKPNSNVIVETSENVYDFKKEQWSHKGLK